VSDEAMQERQEHRLQRQIVPERVEARGEDEHAPGSAPGLDERRSPVVEAGQHRRLASARSFR
jgi:hypothetical protein